MAKTSTDWANGALSKLGMVGLGQSPDAEDTAKALLKFEAFKNSLQAEDIYTIADDDDIDIAAFEWLVLYGAYFLATDFMKPQDDTMRQAAEYHLKLQTSKKPTYQVAAADHF